MDSHPNFKGYDATRGKGRRAAAGRRPHKKNGKKHERSTGRASVGALLEHVGPVNLSDMPDDCPAQWIGPINDVREYAVQQGFQFAMSPFEYQIAKITGDGFCIVLWRSRNKQAKRLYIKPAFEGAHAPGSGDVMDKITGLLPRA